MGLFNTEHVPRSVLPPRAITANTIKPDGRVRTHCHKCGAAYVEGKNFCVECGATKQLRQSLSLGAPRTKAVELAKYLTGWLAENPYVYDVRLSGELRNTHNDFDRIGQIIATNINATYSLADKPYHKAYGVEYVYCYRVTLNFSKIMNATSETLVQEWQQLNPDLKVETWFGGHTTTSQQGIYQLYALIVYSKDITPAQTPQPQIAQPTVAAPPIQFCRHCGHKLSEPVNFCDACGGKLKE